MFVEDIVLRFRFAKMVERTMPYICGAAVGMFAIAVIGDLVKEAYEHESNS